MHRRISKSTIEFFGENKESVKSFCFLMYSMESSLKSVTSAWLGIMMGTMFSNRIFSMKGYSTSMVRGSFAAYCTYFIAKLSVLEPTKLVFLWNS